MPPAWGDSVYPDRPINYVVPNAAGGTGEAITRILAEKLHADLQGPIVIENRAGATGVKMALRGGCGRRGRPA